MGTSCKRSTLLQTKSVLDARNMLGPARRTNGRSQTSLLIERPFLREILKVVREPRPTKFSRCSKMHLAGLTVAIMACIP